jgi:hypothetical protein
MRSRSGSEPATNSQQPHATAVPQRKKVSVRVQRLFTCTCNGVEGAALVAVLVRDVEHVTHKHRLLK